MPQTQTPATTTLGPPPEGIYRSFEDLLTAVQRVAKDNGYEVVKLRASNYREGKPTRYDLVCDRGGVKYSSTAKKRNPSTRKVDCPFRAKAVCEVSLNNQWRFAVQDPRHNHEARAPTVVPGNDNTPLAQSLRALSNKLDRMSHDQTQGLARLDSRFDGMEKRLEAIERHTGMASSTGMANMPNNMGNGMGNGIGNGMGNGMAGAMGSGPSMVDSRLSNFEARMNAVESRVNGSMGMPMDDVDEQSRQLLSQVNVM